MSVSLFFEFFYSESKELLAEINALASGLLSVDVPTAEEAEKFIQLVQKLHRLIGGMASIGFSMYAPLSHETSVLADRCTAMTKSSIKRTVSILYVIAADFSAYFTTMDKAKDVEALAPVMEKRIHDCMEESNIHAGSIVCTQAEIDDIMKMFGNV